MAGNSIRGGARRNAGRKSNASKLLLAGFSAPWLTPELQKSRWTDFINSEDQRIALDALKYITDRLYGKAVAPVDVKGDLNVSIAHIIVEAQKRLTGG